MNLEQKLGVSLELRQAQLIKLEQRLSQKTGKFEKQLLKKIELIDIDLDESPYHVDMLGVLVVRESEEKKLPKKKNSHHRQERRLHSADTQDLR